MLSELDSSIKLLFFIIIYLIILSQFITFYSVRLQNNTKLIMQTLKS